MIVRRSKRGGVAPHGVPTGYTLLELITALGIASFLVYAVYLTLEMHYLYLETGRQKVDNTQQVRSLIALLRNDIRNTFAQWTPVAASAATQGSTTGSSTTGSTGSTTNSTTGSTGSTQSSTTQNSSTGQSTTESDIPPGGVSGAESTVSLIVRVPIRDQDHNAIGTSLASLGNTVTDTRLLRYYIDGKTLIREESTYISSHSQGADPSTNAKVDRLADNITNITFQYYDGADWLTTWDNSHASAPRAIKVVLTVQQIRSNADDGIELQNPPEADYTFTVAIPDAPASTSGG